MNNCIFAFSIIGRVLCHSLLLVSLISRPFPGNKCDCTCVYDNVHMLWQTVLIDATCIYTVILFIIISYLRNVINKLMNSLKINRKQN